MTFGPALRHLAPLAVLATAFAFWQPAPSNAQSGERYDDRPPASDRGYGDDRDRDDDRDAPPRDGWRDDDRRDNNWRDDDRGRSSVDAFYDDLDQYGRWEEHPRYGEIWTPDDVGRGWRPYTVGHWTFTDEYGWYWVSSEPWGWATYHYGRWAWDDRFGWFWIPGDEWAPAWVTWRYSDDVIGWAPLPPRGRRLGDDYFASAAFASAWIFVRPRFFTMQGLHRFAQPASLNSRALTMTRPAGMPQRSGQRTVNLGIDLRTVERITQRRITPSRIATTENRNDPSILKPRFGSVTVYRPRNLTGGPSGTPSRWSQPQTGGSPPAAGRRSAPANASPGAGAPPAAGASPAPDGGRPGGFERRRAGGTPPPAPGAAPAPAQTPPKTTPPGTPPPPAAPSPSAAPAPASPPPQAQPPQRDRDRDRDRDRNRDRPRADQRPPSSNAPPPQQQAAPPAAQPSTPVQPRILNQAPPAPPPARPAPPPAAAAPPPRPAPPAAAPAAAQAKPAPPAKDQKDRGEHKKKPEGEQPPPKQ